MGSRPRPAARRAGPGDARRIDVRRDPGSVGLERRCGALPHGQSRPVARRRLRRFSGRYRARVLAAGRGSRGIRATARGVLGAGGESGNTLLVDSPRFKLQYAVDDGGPNGPATVELWITQDGGRTWIRRGEDPDRASPIDVDLGGEGTYGVCLVARSAAGLGDQPPAPGIRPRAGSRWMPAPAVQLDPVQVGTGVNSGKIAITWRATDLHLAPKSVAILWRPDQPGTSWQPVAEAQENTGRYIWTVPQSVPARFHVRVEAADSVGHRGFAESTESGPIMVDRSRPRSRIIGLDPNARSGLGPSGLAAAVRGEALAVGRTPAPPPRRSSSRACEDSQELGRPAIFEGICGLEVVRHSRGYDAARPRTSADSSRSARSWDRAPWLPGREP